MAIDPPHPTQATPMCEVVSLAIAAEVARATRIPPYTGHTNLADTEPRCQHKKP